MKTKCCQVYLSFVLKHERKVTSRIVLFAINKKAFSYISFVTYSQLTFILNLTRYKKVNGQSSWIENEDLVLEEILYLSMKFLEEQLLLKVQVIIVCLLYCVFNHCFVTLIMANKKPLSLSLTL